MGEVYNITKIKIDRNFSAFIDFISLELEVPTICLVTGGVSVRRDRRYVSGNILGKSNFDYWCCAMLTNFRGLFGPAVVINSTNVKD